MAALASTLPTDVAALQAMVLAQRAELTAARAGIMTQSFEVEALKARLAKLLCTFGRSFEKLREQIAQLELILGDIDESLAETAAPESPSDAPSSMPETQTRTKLARRPLPPSLPRDTVEHDAPCCYKTDAGLACSSSLRPLDEDVTEIVDYVAGRAGRRRPGPSCWCRNTATATTCRCQAEIYARDDVDQPVRWRPWLSCLVGSRSPQGSEAAAASLPASNNRLCRRRIAAPLGCDGLIGGFEHDRLEGEVPDDCPRECLGLVAYTSLSGYG